MKYVLMIQDVFFKVVVAIPISDKSDAKLKLQNWMTQFMNVTDDTIKILRNDNGTEFKNNLLEQFLVSKGIIHEFSMPYEHHQNGRIERTNRTILEMARPMLHASNLPTYLWPWEFPHAAWIFNCTLHTNNTRTPFELLGKRKPSLQMLRVFGATSFIHDHNFKKNLLAKAVTGYHLGIAEYSKGWIFWIPQKKIVARSASAKFDERLFYRPDANQIKSIQVHNLFDKLMIDEIINQDKLITEISSTTNLNVMLPTKY
ncbi:hypothetical protein O181_084207 [Austropuccinia psidii MF-1]|uniref:Integrase catalytic domain-containing protein n=1 Tax=Austropuccinia psidii MF-1 TaxID=1389203 RepID=A0A9Q3FTT0_9BASI|nr:hypothetical protein [Austropuccinia psidii MF-1]